MKQKGAWQATGKSWGIPLACKKGKQNLIQHAAEQAAAAGAHALKPQQSQRGFTSPLPSPFW